MYEENRVEFFGNLLVLKNKSWSTKIHARTTINTMNSSTSFGFK